MADTEALQALKQYVFPTQPSPQLRDGKTTQLTVMHGTQQQSMPAAMRGAQWSAQPPSRRQSTSHSPAVETYGDGHTLPSQPTPNLRQQQQQAMCNPFPQSLMLPHILPVAAAPPSRSEGFANQSASGSGTTYPLAATQQLPLASHSSNDSCGFYYYFPQTDRPGEPAPGLGSRQLGQGCRPQEQPLSHGNMRMMAAQHHWQHQQHQQQQQRLTSSQGSASVPISTTAQASAVHSRGPQLYVPNGVRGPAVPPERRAAPSVTQPLANGGMLQHVLRQSHHAANASANLTTESSCHRRGSLPEEHGPILSYIGAGGSRGSGPGFSTARMHNAEGFPRLVNGSVVRSASFHPGSAMHCGGPAGPLKAGAGYSSDGDAVGDGGAVVRWPTNHLPSFTGQPDDDEDGRERSFFRPSSAMGSASDLYGSVVVDRVGVPTAVAQRPYDTCVVERSYSMLHRGGAATASPSQGNMDSFYDSRDAEAAASGLVVAAAFAKGGYDLAEVFASENAAKATATADCQSHSATSSGHNSSGSMANNAGSATGNSRHDSHHHAELPSWVYLEDVDPSPSGTEGAGLGNVPTMRRLYSAQSVCSSTSSASRSQERRIQGAAKIRSGRQYQQMSIAKRRQFPVRSLSVKSITAKGR